MRGQYTILSEILIFSVGLAIASYVSMSFSGVKEFIGSVSTDDKMENAAITILNSIGASIREKSYIVLEIPQAVSGKVYRIRVVDAGGGECALHDDCFLNLSTADASVAKQIFNISQSYSIKGDLYSSARFLTITSGNGEIVLGRV